MQTPLTSKEKNAAFITHSTLQAKNLCLQTAFNTEEQLKVTVVCTALLIMDHF